MSDDLVWIRDALDRIETGQKDGFSTLNGRVRNVEEKVAVHTDQIDGKGGLHDRADEGEKKQAKSDKKLLILGLVVLGGTGVASNLGPIGGLLKGLFGL